MKIFLSALVLCFSSLSFSQEGFEIRVLGFESTEDFVRLNRPHVTIEGEFYNFGATKNTYEGICKNVLEGVFEILEVSKERKNTGTAYLNLQGEFTHLGAIARSFSSIKCLK